MCRVPCEYEGKNLAVRVEERSRPPNDLAVRFLYQGGQTDIVAVDVAQVQQTHQFAESLPGRRVRICVY
jgi:hypothetical protein